MTSAGESRAVLLDMGGVLLDFHGDPGIPSGRNDFRGREAMRHRLRESGLALSAEELDARLFAPWRREFERRDEIGRDPDWRPHFERLLRGVELEVSAETLLALWFRPLAETVVPVPGALEAVEALARAGKGLALVSNVPLPGSLYLPLLEQHGLGHHLQHKFFSYDEGTRRPSPALLRRALSALVVEPGDAVMVGDRRRVDVAAGRSAGVRTVWLENEDGGGPAPDRVIRHMSDLPDLV